MLLVIRSSFLKNAHFHFSSLFSHYSRPFWAKIQEYRLLTEIFHKRLFVFLSFLAHPKRLGNPCNILQSQPPKVIFDSRRFISVLEFGRNPRCHWLSRKSRKQRSENVFPLFPPISPEYTHLALNLSTFVELLKPQMNIRGWDWSYEQGFLGCAKKLRKKKKAFRKYMARKSIFHELYSSPEYPPLALKCITFC